MDRKPFLLRLDPRTMGALQRWAPDEVRSLNAQIEFLLCRVLAQAGRLKSDDPDSSGGTTRRKAK